MQSSWLQHWGLEKARYGTRTGAHICGLGWRQGPSSEVLWCDEGDRASMRGFSGPWARCVTRDKLANATYMDCCCCTLWVPKSWGPVLKP